MKKIVDILSLHPFFRELAPADLDFISGCAKNAVFAEKQLIAKPGEAADVFYLIRHGLVALLLEAPPSQPFIFQTLGEGDILGLSWLVPPYRWSVTAQAIQTTRVIAIDGACLRKKCEEDHSLGFKLMKQLAQVMAAREEASRLHLLDVYGVKNRP